MYRLYHNSYRKIYHRVHAERWRLLCLQCELYASKVCQVEYSKCTWQTLLRLVTMRTWSVSPLHIWKIQNEMNKTVLQSKYDSRVIYITQSPFARHILWDRTTHTRTVYENLWNINTSIRLWPIPYIVSPPECPRYMQYIQRDKDWGRNCHRSTPRMRNGSRSLNGMTGGGHAEIMQAQDCQGNLKYNISIGSKVSLRDLKVTDPSIEYYSVLKTKFINTGTEFR